MKLSHVLSFIKLTNRCHIFGPCIVRHCHSSDVSHNVESDIFESPKDIPLAPFRRGIPTTITEYYQRKKLTPTAPTDPQILKVAMLGEPNVGKSTLTNRLMKWTVCAVSKKVHTTRKKTALILVDDNKQIVFVDTPGFVTPEHSKKHHLEVSLVADPELSVQTADLIAVIVDASNKWTNNRIHEDILRLLSTYKDKKSILILNKIDAQKKRTETVDASRNLSRGALNGIIVDPGVKAKVLEKPAHKVKKLTLEEIFERTEKMLEGQATTNEDILLKPLEHFQGAKGWPFFSKVFFVSALNGDGVDELRSYLLKACEPGDWSYHQSNVIDDHPHDIALMLVRQILLEELPEEIPYKLNLKVKQWYVDETDCLRIHIVIGCPKPRYKALVIGKSGSRIGKFVEKARQLLQDTFRSEIFLRLGIE